MGRAPRLYVDMGLAAGGSIELASGQAHYLRSVLRLGPSAAVAVFNSADGEWLSHIVEVGKSKIRLTVESQLREAGPESDLWLVFTPIKRARLDWLVEKATELGVSALLPVWTARTQPERINIERLRAHATEAAEQSERLSVPELRAPEKLEHLLAAWPRDRRLIACDETGAAEPIGKGITGWAHGPAALLVGPEGGFDQTELDAIAKLSIVTRVGLGPRVLRAETAAVAALAVFQAIAGDWRHSRTR
ncbi:MAG TPA: 16S rRNA (uracil(1498)-N(3))-methyltransferase [Stellaceae bacterium]|nr:16S rRNA (uracil(1498)-N(3))-methyltransferase [Stellaceae bacterium]